MCMKNLLSAVFSALSAICQEMLQPSTCCLWDQVQVLCPVCKMKRDYNYQ
jgi:hypothetical protein